jgi:hypothetical protein
VTFETGIPGDWIVVDNTGGSGIVWCTTTDSACDQSNQTGGSGEAACADSDAAGVGAPPYDTELVSNAFDLPSDYEVMLSFRAAYKDVATGNDRFDVDVWNGTTWTNELSWDENHLPAYVGLGLSAYAGLTGVKVRFRYLGNGFDWWAQVDDVELICQDLDRDFYIKDSMADDGSVASSTPWWLSPDIWIRNDCDCENLEHQNAGPGERAVCVRVRNRMSMTADDITVDIYRADPALVHSWPDSWTFIGSIQIPSLEAGADVAIVQAMLWIEPDVPAYGCLLARAGSSQDPLAYGFDSVSPVDYTRNNNNIAQQNTIVVDYPWPSGCGINVQTMHFDVINPWNSSKVVDVEFDSGDFPLGSGQVEVQPGDLWGRWTSLTGFNQVGTTLVATSFPATMGGISMTSHETSRLTMTLSVDIRQQFNIHVVESIGGVDEGGLKYVSTPLDCVGLPLITKNSP